MSSGIPYVGPPAHTTPGRNRPVRRIVIHATVSPCEPGGARANAAYFRSEAATGSAHYVVDPSEVVRVAYDDVICWHAPPNANSVGIELCDPQTGHAARWADEAHVLMLRRAARQVARLCHLHKIPVHRLTVDEVRAGDLGICGHVEVSEAFHQSTHTDPGVGFPWLAFMARVQVEYEALTPRPVPPPAPTPVPPTPKPNPSHMDTPRVYVRARLGDSMSRIAKRHGITLEHLERLNPSIHRPWFIRVGRKVRVK